MALPLWSTIPDWNSWGKETFASAKETHKSATKQKAIFFIYCCFDDAKIAKNSVEMAKNDKILVQ
jgi:hypothetical protein